MTNNRVKDLTATGLLVLAFAAGLAAEIGFVVAKVLLFYFLNLVLH